MRSFCEHVWLGVASTSHTLDSSDWLGKQQGGWVYGSNGSACHATNQDNGPYLEVHPKFTEGEIVTLTLDLAGDGKMFAEVRTSIDSKVEVFNNMFASFKNRRIAAFVPAVSLMAPGKVTFLDMNSKY